jgi:hypothetical protein
LLSKLLNASIKNAILKSTKKPNFTLLYPRKPNSSTKKSNDSTLSQKTHNSSSVPKKPAQVSSTPKRSLASVTFAHKNTVPNASSKTTGENANNNRFFSWKTSLNTSNAPTATLSYKKTKDATTSLANADTSFATSVEESGKGLSTCVFDQKVFSGLDHGFYL